jgi:diguanylate cyclase
MNDSSAFSSFHDAALAVLGLLHRRVGFALWMVTRVEDKDWIVLAAEDHAYGIGAGAVFRWADSFCSRMIKELGPRIAPSTRDVPAYATASLAAKVPIGAYVGVPLTWNEGQLFGTLCGIHPTAMPSTIVGELGLIELQGRLLSAILQAELKAQQRARELERWETAALTDPLTGLYNRRGWERLIVAEETRCQRYGHPACMLSADLDNLKAVNDSAGHSRGDQLIMRTAEIITRVVRTQDVAARIGGDEFAILAVECDSSSVQAFVERLHNEFADAGIAVSIGSAQCDPAASFALAWETADANMYACKRAPSLRRNFQRADSNL